MTLDAFVAKAKTDPNYAAFLAKFGNKVALTTLYALYDRNLRMMLPAGGWSSIQAADYNRVHAGNTLLRVAAADMATFDMFLSEQMRQDVIKTTAREIYLATLKITAAAGGLQVRLAARTQLESTYYTAPVPSVPRPGAPPIPPKPPRSINTNRALGWAVGNPGAAAAVNTTYYQAFVANTTTNVGFPLGSMTKLNAIWSKLVIGAPGYRAVNIMQPTNYPSSVAGDFIVRNIIADFATTPQPAQGAAAWYDWALYFFAAIMTSQAFTDGNKRVARLAYGLILVDGGVPFIAPDNVLGAELGDM